MATWNEKVKAIQQLRENRRKANDTLYSTRIDLLKSQKDLVKVKNKQVLHVLDTAAIENLRGQIADQETSVTSINVEINDIDHFAEKVKTAFDKANFLEKTIQTSDGELKALNRQLQKMKRLPRPDRQKIRKNEIAVGKAKVELDKLTGDLDRQKTEATRLAGEQQELQTKKQQLQNGRDVIIDQIKSLELDLNEKLNPPPVSEEVAEKKTKELGEKKKKFRNQLDVLVQDLDKARDFLFEEPHPKSVVKEMDDGIPFLLFPVKIETRFMTNQNPPELWVRVYPDDIAIHTHEQALTADEITAGEEYWRLLFQAEKNEDTDKEQSKKTAWTTITALFGPQRSAWVAKQTIPVNWSSHANISSAEQLSFPTQAESKPFEWSRAPRTNVLPDKFVVMLYQGDTITREAVGNTIPDELFVGPDPLEAEESFKEAETDHMLTIGPSFDWTADFDRAVEKGMGLRIPLTAAEAGEGFDKILVAGVYVSADEEGGRQAVETLIDNHHYSPKGFGLVKQGLPTNNADHNGSGFSTNDPFDTISYFVETAQPLFDENTDCDGRNLANALGIAYTPLQYIVNSDGKDLKEAMAMNTALYPSTLGYYFDTMLKPVMGQTKQDELRDFYTRFVSGRGPLPAVRVGNQPYGVLLTSDFSNWQWQRQETGVSNSFLPALQKVLITYSDLWKSLLNQLHYTGKPGIDAADVLLNILGLQPGSVSFFQRNAYSTELLENNAAFEFEGKYYGDLVSSFSSKAELLQYFSQFGFEPPVVNGKKQIPQLLRLVYQHYHTRLNPKNIVEGFPLSESAALHNYAENKNYLHWLLETNSIEQLERQDFGQGVTRPNSLLYMQLRRALLLAITDASVSWFGKHNVLVSQVKEPLNFHNIRAQRDITKWEVMKGKVGLGAPDDPEKQKSIADHLLTTGINEADALFLKNIKVSLQTLANSTTASLERCFTEHIDTCTYRLDAWQAGLFTQRLYKQRNLADPNPANRKTGIYLGAYGWLEDVRPGSKRQISQSTIPDALQPPNGHPVFEYADNGGFVHAPSINQATAAAVLRSGYLNYASSDQPDLMAVNLSSERVRRALFILEGLANGQMLEVLLGQQFERGLHDRGSANDDLKRLNEYIYAYREAFTISRHVVHQQGETSAANETIETNHVVNGLKLAESELLFPYGASLSFQGLTDPQISEVQKAIVAEKDKLEDTLDAIKDLLLSESVYQMVQGNYDRAAAVVGSLKDVDVPPPIEVIDTPLTSHLAFTNKCTIHFDPNVTYLGSISARAGFEPGLNKWLSLFTGPVENLVCNISHASAGVIEQAQLSLSDLRLEPIDLVYLIGNTDNADQNAAASALENRVAFFYRKKMALTDDTIINIQFLGADPAAGKKFIGTVLPILKNLKSLITDSRPLHALDFEPLSTSVPKGRVNPHGYLIEELRGRVKLSKESIFDTYRANLSAIPVSWNIEGQLRDITLGEFFTALADKHLELTSTDITIGASQLFDLQNILIDISGFGIPDSFPVVVDISTGNRKYILLQQVQDVLKQMDIAAAQASAVLSQAQEPTLTNENQVRLLSDAAKALFGQAFIVIPKFNYNNPTAIQQSHADTDQLLKYANHDLGITFPADEWMQKTATVRPRIAKWDSIRSMYELLTNEQLSLSPVQVPYRANDSWLALEFPAQHPDGSPFTIDQDTFSILAQGESAFATSSAQCGLLVDEWTEMVPGNEALTGLTFNYNQPDAMPPQAILLAVTPNETGKWSWEKLVGILNDTLLRAKLRAVEPALLDQLKKPETGVLLPGVISTFTQQGLDISLDYRNNWDFFEHNLPLNNLG